MRIGEFLIAGRPGKYGDRGHKKKIRIKKKSGSKTFFSGSPKKNGLDRNEGRKEGGREGKGRERKGRTINYCHFALGGGAAP